MSKIRNQKPNFKNVKISNHTSNFKMVKISNRNSNFKNVKISNQFSNFKMLILTMRILSQMRFLSPSLSHILIHGHAYTQDKIIADKTEIVSNKEKEAKDLTKQIDEKEKALTSLRSERDKQVRECMCVCAREKIVCM